MLTSPILISIIYYMKYILAIDQGTTGSRAIIYDKRGSIVCSSYMEFPQIFPKSGWVEHNPLEIWESVIKTIQAVLKKVSSKEILAIGITNQRETTLVWDRKTGKPIYSAIVWQCRRTADRCERLKKKKGFESKIKRVTGLPLDAYFSATKIEWILKKVNGSKTRADKGELCFGTTDSWILWNLTGGQSHATDYTNASRTMLFDIKNKRWDKELLKEFGVSEKMVPKVQNSISNFGTTVKHKLLPAGIPITGIAGDQQAALFGQACFNPGTLKNTYGTGSFLLLNTGNKFIKSKKLITTLGCGPKGKPIYVLEGAVFIAGAAIQWLRDELKIIGNAKESEKIASMVKSTDGVYLVPAFVGLGAPHWKPETRAAIMGLTRSSNRSHVVRAALEAMAYSTRDVINLFASESGLKIKRLKIDGGAVENNLLCQLQADILGVEVIRPKGIETTSLGAAYMAGLGVGLWKDEKEIAKIWKKDKSFFSKIKKSERDLLCKGWDKAVNAVIGMV